MAPKTIAVSLEAIEVHNGQRVALVFEGPDGTRRCSYSLPEFMVPLIYIMEADRKSRMGGLTILGAKRRRVPPRSDVYELRSDGGEMLNLGSAEDGPCIPLLFSLLHEGSGNVSRIRQAMRSGSSITISTPA
jgi:hypothetical protein